MFLCLVYIISCCTLKHFVSGVAFVVDPLHPLLLFQSFHRHLSVFVLWIVFLYLCSVVMRNAAVLFGAFEESTLTGDKKANQVLYQQEDSKKNRPTPQRCQHLSKKQSEAVQENVRHALHKKNLSVLAKAAAV